MGGNRTVPVGPKADNRGGTTQLGLQGRWWDNQQFVRTIGIDSRQQRRMDDIFAENRGTLIRCYQNLKQEQTLLDRATQARGLNEGQILQQIDRVSQARGELEKANAHMLLQIRKELTPEQTARLEEQRLSQPQ